MKAEPPLEPAAPPPPAAPLAALAVFLTLKQLRERLPLSERTIRGEIKKGHIPCIKLHGARRLLFDWESVRTALLRQQRGGDAA